MRRPETDEGLVPAIGLGEVADDRRPGGEITLNAFLGQALRLVGGFDQPRLGLGPRRWWRIARPGFDKLHDPCGSPVAGDAPNPLGPGWLGVYVVGTK
jgi:hypothetical protein